MSEHRKKLRWFVTLSTLPLLGVVTAFGLVSQDDLGLPAANVAIEEIALARPLPVATPQATFWHSEQVQRGDTADDLLRRLNVEDASASAWLRTAADAASFRSLAPGREVQAETDAAGNLVSLRYPDKDGAQTVIEKQQDVFSANTMPALLETRLAARSAEITSSLYGATDAAGIPDAVANQLAELFGGDIDFHHDLRKGDRFTVVYETLYSNGAPLRTGRIQAAEFVNQGHTYRAVYFENGAQRGDYYTPEGKSVRKAFLRSPIEFSRVSSGFTRSRFHPVLNKWRSHKGVDFAAASGTRVKATADGTVALVGRQGGYGNVIMINHQGRFTTVYGHLSAFARGLHKGRRVTQGEVIGYVGMTGLASGPHLHYEFKVDGQQRDPLRIALPDASPVASADRAAFQSAASDLIARLELLRNTNLALLD
ncbi:MAG: peptidase M23 [Gallionellales bacterium GWA2_60_18]|nr:MAG: peptidase M23 [Gallionellales bacterium GWA2_60_18]